MKKYRKHNKLILTAILGSFGLVSIMGLASYQKQEYKSASAMVEPYTRNVSYDDEQYQITLSADEMNNYDWNNFNSYCYENEDNTLTGATYGEHVATYYDNAGSLTIEYEYLSNTYTFYIIDNHFVLRMSGDSITIDDNLTLSISSSAYNQVKSAIELDIQANQPEVDKGDTMISAISSGMGLIPDIANEFVKGFSAIFWDSTNSQLTSASTFMLVFLGIAIVMAIIKLCLMLLRNNTGA